MVASLASYTITKIVMPTYTDWGILQINDLSNTYFRFDVVNGKPKLDTSLFANQLENPKEKHQYFNAQNELYQDIQRLVNEYFNRHQFECLGKIK